jgi:hypothetical protein
VIVHATTHIRARLPRFPGIRRSFQALGLWHGTLAGDHIDLTRELDYGKRQHLTARRLAKR